MGGVDRKLRRLLARVLRRRRVPAGVGGRRRRGPGFPHGWDGWNGEDGGAGVREPRRPRPSGPQGSGAAQPPPPPEHVHLPDASR
ncbi:hypothetical protein [Gandjariella thermophila]|uniref:Uncharacterized protein n=1 Tax=Gandjariella thermophila TaxID=1931992 RepID=A0A4D4J9N9_9PSEU|nr:hypothetical protein [Gandjariella thermophila]GDY31388.1 hypothetical protein GTS_30210 [Gandjariella thermophila]